MISIDLTRRGVVIGEVGQAHDGSLGTAHSYIDAIANAGAHGVKFQAHLAHAESTPTEPWRVKFSPQDETRYAYWQRMEFTEPQWLGLREHCDEAGLAFVVSPFSVEAVEMLERVGVSAWKVASGEMVSTTLLSRMAATGVPVILSSGMSPLSEVRAAYDLVASFGAPPAVMQCTSAYPCPPERLGLNAIAELAAEFGGPIGLSDHSGTTYAGLAAVTLGASFLEVHVTFSRQAFGPDVPASLLVEELADLVRGVEFIERALSHPVDKEAMAAELAPLRRLFTKSLVAAQDLAPGHLLTSADLIAKKPGDGIPEVRCAELIGRRLATAVRADEQFTIDHLEPTS